MLGALPVDEKPVLDNGDADLPFDFFGFGQIGPGVPPMNQPKAQQNGPDDAPAANEINQGPLQENPPPEIQQVEANQEQDVVMEQVADLNDQVQSEKISGGAPNIPNDSVNFVTLI